MESATQIRLATFQKAGVQAKGTIASLERMSTYVSSIGPRLGFAVHAMCFLSWCSRLVFFVGFMCSQDVEYNSQTFTKLESDLVRGNADLKSYQKEVKDRTGPVSLESSECAH